jgi:hypothetical protein
MFLALTFMFFLLQNQRTGGRKSSARGRVWWGGRALLPVGGVRERAVEG